MSNKKLAELLGIVMSLQDEMNERFNEIKEILCEEIGERIEEVTE